MARNRKAVLKAKKRVDEKRALLEKEAQAKAAQKVPSANESASKEPQVSSSSIDVTDTPPKKDAGDTASVSSAASNKEAGRRKRKAKTDRKPRRERFDPKPFQNAEVEPAENILVFLMYITPYLQMQMGEHAFRVFPGLVYVSTTLKQYQIAEATGTDPRTVRAGTDDFMSGNIPSGPKSRQRRSGGGRKKAMEKYRHLCDYIRHLIDAVCYGSCTAKGAVVNHVSLSCGKIRSYLKTHYNIRIGVSTVYLTLRLMNITPKANRKLKNANKTHITPVMQMRHDRQFLKISKALKMARRRKTKKYPILSLDCKKKENLGDYAYSGKAWTYKGEPILVYDHDFIVTLDIESLDGMEDLLTRAEGKAVPYGIYDILRNEGYVNIGISHDTPAFAVASLEAFLPEILKHYPNADKVVLMLDGGGSNGAHSHVFKHEIEKLSRRIGLKFEMYHYPPGKSKYLWEISHKYFYGKPLVMGKFWEKTRITA